MDTDGTLFEEELLTGTEKKSVIRRLIMSRSRIGLKIILRNLHAKDVRKGGCHIYFMVVEFSLPHKYNVPEKDSAFFAV